MSCEVRLLTYTQNTQNTQNSPWHSLNAGCVACFYYHYSELTAGKQRGRIQTQDHLMPDSFIVTPPLPAGCELCVARLPGVREGVRIWTPELLITWMSFLHLNFS